MLLQPLIFCYQIAVKQLEVKTLSWIMAIPLFNRKRENMSLEIKKLKKKMNEQEIIKGINLTIPEGEIYGFLGANGAGKTTIFRHILGIYSPDEGEITWQGRKVDRFDAKEVGYLPEERGLYPKRTVRQQLTFFGKLRKMKKKEIEKSILFWLDFLRYKRT